MSWLFSLSKVNDDVMGCKFDKIFKKKKKEKRQNDYLLRIIFTDYKII